MASTGAAQAVDTTVSKLYSSGQGCGALYIKNLGSQALLVHVPGIHDGTHTSGDYFTILQNEEFTFRLNQNGIKVVYAKTAAASTTVQFGATEQNFNG